MDVPFISIHIPSNRMENLAKNFDRLQQLTTDLNSFEIIVNLDQDDTVISRYLEEEKAKRPFIIKYIKTFSGGFYNSWKPINDMLPHVHPNAYFFIFISDEFLFTTQGWDQILKQYIGYYPDHLFRLRASQYRFRNYIDYWECGFAPDSIAFTTRRWLDIIGDWGPCFSSDAFQQCVAYYLYTSDPFTKEQMNRDIALPFIKFEGEGASIGLTGEKAIERARGGLRAWFTLMSYPMQLEAKRRAMLLKANIIVQENRIFEIVDNAKKKRIEIVNLNEDKVDLTLDYSINKWAHNYTNFIRKFNYLHYAGGGAERKMALSKLRSNITYYLSYRYDALKKLHDRCNHCSNSLRAIVKKLLFQ